MLDLTPETFVWTTFAGRKFRLHEIEDTHLQHIERFLLGHGRAFKYKGGPKHEELRIAKLRIIQDEMERRGLEPLPLAPSRPLQDTEKPREEYTPRELRNIALELNFKSYGRKNRARLQSHPSGCPRSP